MSWVGKATKPESIPPLKTLNVTFSGTMEKVPCHECETRNGVLICYEILNYRTTKFMAIPNKWWPKLRIVSAFSLADVTNYEWS